MAKLSGTRLRAVLPQPNLSPPAATMSLLCLSLLFLSAPTAFGQTSTQQYVYLSLPGSPPSSPTSFISAFSKAGQTGALSDVPGSPFSDRLEGGLVAIDGQRKFLFLLNSTSNDISMFQIDQSTGALSGVPGSPFAVPPAGPNPAPSHPIYMISIPLSSPPPRSFTPTKWTRKPESSPKSPALPSTPALPPTVVVAWPFLETLRRPSPALQFRFFLPQPTSAPWSA